MSLPIAISLWFVLSFLMVSNVPFDAIPKPTVGYIRAHPRKSAAYGLAILLIAITQQIGILIVLSVYLLHGLVRAVYRLVQAVMNAPVEEEEERESPFSR